jgi:hypothetical protein
MSNEFKSVVPGTRSFVITPDDDVNLSQNARSLRVDVGGTLKFTTVGGTTDTWEVSDKETIPMQIQKVFATGTTATGIHGIV